MDSGLAGSQCMVEAYKRVERAIWNGGVEEVDQTQEVIWSGVQASKKKNKWKNGKWQWWKNHHLAYKIPPY